MVKQVQTSAEWLRSEDQIWMARHVRQWALDPAHKFMNAEAPNEFEREMMGLFDSMEGLGGDIDERIKKLHQLWEHSNFLTKQWYRLKVPYLLRGAGYEVSERARKMKTKSASQMLANWGRISIIVNAQHGPDWAVSKAWIGPVTERQEPGVVLAAPSWGPPTEKPSWLRRALGEWTDIGGGRYINKSGGMAEGPLARLLYGPHSRKMDEIKEQDSAADIDLGRMG